MSARTRRSLVGGLIILYFIWPLVQHQLVLRYRIDPWKLAGWAMYSAPSARVRISLVGVDDAGARARISPASPAALAETLEDFVLRRRTLGLFVEPEEVAQKLLALYPNYLEWTVVVDQVGLTRENWFGVIHRSTYRYANLVGTLGPVDINHPAIPTDQAIRPNL